MRGPARAALPEAVAGRALWTAILSPDAPPVPCDEDALAGAAARFAHLTSPTVAAWLAQSLCDRHPGLIAAADRERAHQFNRFQRARAREALAPVVAAGIDVLVFKGMATASRFYPDPLIRLMGDVDLLVRPADAGRLCDLLEGRGFHFHKSADTPVWGLSSESSFHPLVAADGQFIFDLHVAPDDYPVSRALDVEAVFADAQPVDIGGVVLRAPSDAHLFLLALTNAGRDKFGPDSVRTLADVVAALTRADYRPDWDRLAALAATGDFLRPVMLAVNLLARLGLRPELLPPRLIRPYRGLAGWAFDALLDDYLTVFAREPGKWALQMRDWLVISAPAVLAHRNWRRLRGLARPWRGLPPGRHFADR